MTGRELSTAAGMAASTVAQIENGSKGRGRPTRETLDKLAAALQITGTNEHRRLLELARRLRPGEKFGASDRSTFEVYLRGDPYLTADQRQALVASYEAYVRLNRARRS